jgi:hypothetical protein
VPASDDFAAEVSSPAADNRPLFTHVDTEYSATPRDLGIFVDWPAEVATSDDLDESERMKHQWREADFRPSPVVGWRAVFFMPEGLSIMPMVG